MQLNSKDAEQNVHFCAERTYLEGRKVYIHLLVGTQFGQHYNSIDECKRICCICSKKLMLQKNCVYQLWMRVMGGLNDDDKWEYAIALVPCCQQCKPSRIRKYSLLMIHPKKDFESIYTYIDEHAFQSRLVEVEGFLAGDRNSKDDVFSALVDSYLYRFALIDSQIPNFCTMLFGKNVCFYCKKDYNIQVCKECNSLYFCKFCQAKAKKHHIEVCQALKRGRLFHADTQVDPIYFIERTKEGFCCKFEPTKVEIYMEILTKEQVAEYANRALKIRNRKDVYDACVALLRNWDRYTGNDERSYIFRKISSESVGNQRLAVNSPTHLNRAYQGWKKEGVAGKSDAVTDAYEKELNKK